jgi:hypothetical protein
MKRIMKRKISIFILFYLNLINCLIKDIKMEIYIKKYLIYI